MSKKPLATEITQADVDRLTKYFQELHMLPKHLLERSPLGKRIAYLEGLRDSLLNREFSSSSRRTRSVIEAIRYNIHMELSLLNNFVMIETNKKTAASRIISDFWVFDVLEGRYVNGKPRTPKDFTACWEGESFGAIKWSYTAKTYIGAKKSARYIFLSEDIEFLRSRLLVDRVETLLEELLSYNFDSIEIWLTDGVPGSGKTTEINTKHIENTDMICTATKAAQLEYLKPGRNPNHYRTYDSIILNGAPQCEVLWGDEALMAHAGEVLIAAFFIKCRVIHLYGDSQQIPFIDRALGFNANKFILNWDHREERLFSWRLPSSMNRIMEKIYPGYENHPKNPLGVLNHYVIKSGNDVPTGYNIILTFSQGEKSIMESITTDLVKTIHEAQGGTFRRVALVRLVPFAVPIYDSKPHCIVGISRHTHTFDYYTVTPCDTLWNVIDGDITGLRDPEEPDPTIPPYPLPVAGRSKRIFKSKYLRPEEREEGFVNYIKSQCAYLFDVPMIEEGYMDIVPDPRDTCDELAVPSIFVQMIYDQLYDRFSKSKEEQYLKESVFPIPAGVKVNWVKAACIKPKEIEFLEPLLLTVQPTRYRGTLIETLMCAYKRNALPPQIHVLRPKSLVAAVFERFVSTFIDPDKLRTGRLKYQYENVAFFNQWVKTRDKAQISAMEGFEFMPTDPNRFGASVKPDHKPRLDGSHNSSLIEGQSLAVHHPLVTASFSGAFQCFAKVLKFSLKEKFIINDGINISELSGHANSLLHQKRLATFLEIDFSKYDKSQEEVILEITKLILLHLGMPKNIVEAWIDCHKLNILVFFDVGVSVRTKFQRKSGDVFTFIGNTIVNMFVLAYTYDLDAAIGGQFGGDDSLIIFDPNYVLANKTKSIAETFNLTAKLIIPTGAPYFCSKFLIFAEGYWRFVPDPIKAITRLGRNDLYCKEHVDYYHISFSDNFKSYLNLEVRVALANAAMLRYKRIFKNKSVSIMPIINFLANVVRNRTVMYSLYRGPKDIWERRVPQNMIRELKAEIDRGVVHEFFDEF